MRRLAALSLALLAGLLLAATGAASAQAEVVWLCKPGDAPNPCRESQATTTLEADGSSRVTDTPLPADPPIDCFYVYPTVSDQKRTNADKAKDPEINAIARYQAARYSRGMPRLRAGLPPADDRLDLHRDDRAARRGPQDRLRRRPRGVARVPRRAQRRARRRPHRPLAGDRDAAPAHARRGRRQARGAPAAGLRAAARGQRRRAQGQARRGRLRQRPRLHVAGADRLRRRVLDLQRAASAQHALRQGAAERHDRRRAARRPGLRGPVHEPRLARRQRAAAAHDVPADRGVPGLDRRRRCS